MKILEIKDHSFSGAYDLILRLGSSLILEATVVPEQRG